MPLVTLQLKPLPPLELPLFILQPVPILSRFGRVVPTAGEGSRFGRVVPTAGDGLRFTAKLKPDEKVWLLFVLQFEPLPEFELLELEPLESVLLDPTLILPKSDHHDGTPSPL